MNTKDKRNNEDWKLSFIDDTWPRDGQAVRGTTSLFKTTFSTFFYGPDTLSDFHISEFEQVISKLRSLVETRDVEILQIIQPERGGEMVVYRFTSDKAYDEHSRWLLTGGLGRGVWDAKDAYMRKLWFDIEPLKHPVAEDKLTLRIEKKSMRAGLGERSSSVYDLVIVQGDQTIRLACVDEDAAIRGYHQLSDFVTERTIETLTSRKEG